MIVVSVYRPEAADSPDEPDAQDRFDGIEVYGIYYDAEGTEVLKMVDKLKDAHEGWQILVATGQKILVGLNKFPMTPAPTARGKKRK